MTLYQNILNSGIEQGIEQGQELKDEIVIRNAVAKGFDDQTIAELTGLSFEKVTEIIKKLNLR